MRVDDAMLLGLREEIQTAAAFNVVSRICCEQVIDEAVKRGEERGLLLLVKEFFRNADWIQACREAEEWAKRRLA